MTDVDAEAGASVSYSSSYGDGYQGEYASVLHGFNGTFNARGYQISSSVGYNRFHLQSYWIEEMDQPCYSTGTIDQITNIFYRLETSDGNTYFKNWEPDRVDVENDGSWASPSFGVTYSPVPFFSVGVTAQVDEIWGSGGSFDEVDYDYIEWNLDWPNYTTSQDPSTGVRLDIANDVKGSGDIVTVTAKSQADFQYPCGRSVGYDSTPINSWNNYIDVIS